MNENCHCGEPLHYTDPKTEKYMRDLVAEVGRFIKVVVHSKSGDKAYMVDRHYVALHGIKAKDLPKLGFGEVPA